MERQLQRLSFLQVRRLVPDKINTVLFPVGTVEAHGSACIGTDNFIPESICNNIADRINALVAPLVNYGITRSLYRYDGSSTIKPEHFQAYIRDILDSFADNGFKNIILMNGHGGNNTALKTIAYDFHKERACNIAVVHWWELCGRMTEEFFGHVGGHAGTDETALIQAIDEKLAEKTDYSEDLAWYFRPGADIYPIPGTILLYKEGEGYPNYDVKQAKEYQQKVFETVGDFVENVLSRWERLGL